MVDFPDPDSPVSHTVAPDNPSFPHRSSRVSSASCHTTLGLLTRTPVAARDGRSPPGDAAAHRRRAGTPQGCPPTVSEGPWMARSEPMSQNHSRPGGGVGGLVDEDEAAG